MNNKGQRIGIVEIQTESSQATQLQLATTTHPRGGGTITVCEMLQQQDHVHALLP